MASSVNEVQVGPDAYTNVSNGNMNCTVFVPNGADLKVVVAGSEPAVSEDTIFIPVKSGSNNRDFSVNNLEAEDDIWVLSAKPMTLKVMRGPAILTFR